jgi:hypothetical protein
MKPIICLGLLITTQLQALPTLYPENFNRVHNHTSSHVIADSESTQRFYVLPPSTSFAKVSSLHTVTANVGFCPEIAKLQEFNLDTVKLIDSLKGRSIEFDKQIVESQKKLVIANQDLAKYVAANNMQELTSLDLKITQLETRLDNIYKNIKYCNQDCALLLSDAEQTQKLRMELTTRRFELSSSYIAVANEYEQKKTFVRSIQDNIDNLNSNLSKVKKDLAELYVDFNRMFDAHAAREGGRVSIDYSSGWSSNVDRLAQDNPNLSFEKITTKNANIKMSAYTKDNLIPKGSVIGFELSGIAAASNLNLEAFPENLTGNVVLNLLGVCPILHPQLFNLKSLDPLRDMNYGLTASYEFPSRLKFELTAEYNLKRVYELIKRQGTSGGFFSSSTWSDQQENEFFKDVFSVKWKDQDEKSQMSFEKRFAIEADLRKQMLSRLASFLIMNDQSNKLTNLLDLPKTGSMVLSNSLVQVCPTNIYCQGSALVINILQAIFGSSEMSQSLLQKTDVNMVENYSSERVVMQPMLVTYK